MSNNLVSYSHVMHPSLSFLAFGRCQWESHTSLSRVSGRVDRTYGSTCRPCRFSSREMEDCTFGEKRCVSGCWQGNCHTHRCEKTTSWRLINSQQQSYEGDNVILDEGLIEECVEHRCTEHGAGSEWQTEHVGNVWSTLLFSLQRVYSFIDLNLINNSYEKNWEKLSRTFSILLKCNAYLSWARNCINLMFELCESSVMLRMLGKNLRVWIWKC